MGSSLYLSGGVQSTDQLVKTISQNNTFSVGNVVRWDTASLSYVLAKADSATNAEVAGVVSSAAATQFTMVMCGNIDLTSVSYLSGINSPALFLSADTAGLVTPNPPSTIGSVVKPILIRKGSAQEYIVSNFLGTQIGGSSTVAIDEIQPVGTIMPFAGSVIPDSWLACDGASYAVGAYPNLYTKLQNSSGDRAPAYGYVVEIGVNTTAYSAWWGAVLVGDTIVYSPTQANLTAATVIQYSLIGKVLAKGASSITVQVYPTYSANKTFVFPNAIPSTGGYIAAFAPSTYLYDSLTNSSRRADAAAAQAGQSPAPAVSTVSVTHFNTPDLRGRFALGVNTSALGELEGDSLISAISGIYSLGSEGGQENILVDNTQLGTGASGKYTVTSNSSTGTIANMPPYTVVRYIIKATPYTRAALIDGLDLPYSQLLVGDLRDGSLRPSGSGEDLVFKTNNGVGGTERMRLTNTPSGAAPGGLVVGDTAHTSGGVGPFTTAYRLLEVATTSGSGGGVFVARSPSTIVEMGANEGLSSAILGTRTNHPLIFRTNTNERMRLDTSGRVGIAITNPTRTLDVGGAIGITSDGYIIQDLPLTYPAWARGIMYNDGGSYTIGAVNGLTSGIGLYGTNTGIQFLYMAHSASTLAPWSSGLGVYVAKNGNVGIGTVSPSAVLDVNGGISASGDLRLNGAVYVSRGATFAKEVKCSTLTTSVSSLDTLTTKSYVDSVNTIGVVPIGGIIMWSGSTVPANWVLCNGQTVTASGVSITTPDLTGKFIMGGSTWSNPSWREPLTGLNTSSGGNKDAVAVSHTHTATTNSAGAHTHPFIPLSTGRDGDDGAAAKGVIGRNAFSSSPNPYGNAGQVMAQAGAHTHTVTVNPVGESGVNKNLPPYYVLAFIMRVA